MVRRKPYRKPQVNQVKLVPEEAVLQNCKAWAARTPASSCKCGGVGGALADGS